MNAIYATNDSLRLKLGHTFSFMKYLASVVSLIFLPKTDWE